MGLRDIQNLSVIRRSEIFFFQPYVWHGSKSVWCVAHSLALSLCCSLDASSPAKPTRREPCTSDCLMRTLAH